VAGVVFSITIVALSLTASQYSPRVLRNFMSDRPTQVVLGAFVAIFAYCLIVLRTIRGGDEGAFVPSLAVLGGVFMAFVGIGLLIYFVHHVATAIQVDYILQRIAADTAAAIDRLYPAEVGDEVPPDALGWQSAVLDGRWNEIHAERTGYLLRVDADALLTLATEHDTVVRVLPRVGDFLVAGMTAVLVAPSATSPPQGWSRSLARCLTVREERDAHQDAAYGLQQLVDVGLRALSPGIHDPTTAVTCVDHIGALLHRVSRRHIESGLREHDGRLRLMLAAPGYADLVEVALAALTHHAGSHAEVHARLMLAVQTAGAATTDPGRLAVLQQRLQQHVARLAEVDLPAGCGDGLRARARDLDARLDRQRLGATARPGAVG
jgi:uncharacterized membrane protein